MLLFYGWGCQPSIFNIFFLYFHHITVNVEIKVYFLVKYDKRSTNEEQEEFTLGGAGVAQWRELSTPDPTNVARVRFPDSMSHVGQLLVLVLSPKDFIPVLRFFSPTTKTNTPLKF